MGLIKSQRGQSLTSVLVSLAIAGVVMMIVMQMSADQSKSMRYFSQKSDLIELKNFVASQMGRSEVCDWQLKGAPGAVINTTTPSSTADIIFTKFYTGVDTTTPIMVSTVATDPGNDYSGLKVNSIKLTNFSGTPGGDHYIADLVIDYDPLTVARSLKPITIHQDIIVDLTMGSPTARPISSCSGSSGTTSFLAPTLITGSIPTSWTPYDLSFLVGGSVQAKAAVVSFCVKFWGKNSSVHVYSNHKYLSDVERIEVAGSWGGGSNTSATGCQQSLIPVVNGHLIYLKAQQVNGVQADATLQGLQ